MIQLDVYREVQAQMVKPGMVVAMVADAQPIDVDSATEHRDGTIQLVGHLAGTDRAATNVTTRRYQKRDVLRVFPSVADTRAVWGELALAIGQAEAKFLDDQELDGEDPHQAAPWSVMDDQGRLRVVVKHQAYYVAPDLPTEPEPGG